MSILPIVDEFIIAMGDNDPGDDTMESVKSIKSDKIKIIDRVWSEEAYVNGEIFADETNFALSQCTGDWCFYLQADEVVHEQDHQRIVQYCNHYKDDKQVDGFLFNYNHFFGDYDHYLPVHGWYKNEMRIVRNNAGIYSIKDAQSFRKGNDEKLNVVAFEPYIYHYGWVRPPELMQSKKKEQDSYYHGAEATEKTYKLRPGEFDYGPLKEIPTFKGSHPKVMTEMMEKIGWKHKLNYKEKGNLSRPKMKHEKLKYKMITFLENTFNGGKDIFGYTNWNKLSTKRLPKP